MRTVNLALTEMRRAKLRFGLLTAAVALLVFLIIFLSSLSGALLRSFTGALESLPADGLVYSEGSRANVQASRLAPDTVAGRRRPRRGRRRTAAVLAANATVNGQPDELQLIGVTPDSPSQPEGLREGLIPHSPTEVAVDASEARSARRHHPGERVLHRPGGHRPPGRHAVRRGHRVDHRRRATRPCSPS